MAVIPLEDAKQFLIVEHSADDALIIALIDAAIGLAERMASQSFSDTANEGTGATIPTALQKSGIKMILARLYENRGGEDLPEQFLQVICNYFIRPDGRVPV